MHEGKNPFEADCDRKVCTNEEGFTGVGKWIEWPTLLRLRLPEILEHEKYGKNIEIYENSLTAILVNFERLSL